MEDEFRSHFVFVPGHTQHDLKDQLLGAQHLARHNILGRTRFTRPALHWSFRVGAPLETIAGDTFAGCFFSRTHDHEHRHSWGPLSAYRPNHRPEHLDKGHCFCL